MTLDVMPLAPTPGRSVIVRVTGTPTLVDDGVAAVTFETSGLMVTADSLLGSLAGSGMTFTLRQR